MARARNIKPGITRNEDLAELLPLYRLGFAYSWMFADCHGVLELRPKRLKADIFPYDDIDIDAWLNALSAGGFIALFSDGERGFIKIINFVKHQNPHKQEREAGSDLPDTAAAEVVIYQTVEALRKSFGSHSEVNVLIPDSLFLIPDSPIQPNGGAEMEEKEIDLPLSPSSSEKETRRLVAVPVNASAQKELETWLDAIAPFLGAKKRSTIADLRKWEDVCIKAISEERSVLDMIDAIKSELGRTKETPQYFSATSVLKKLQTASAKPERKKFLH